MQKKFDLLRSKQSEDTPALSIVHNKNASALENIILTLISEYNDLKSEFDSFSQTVTSTMNKLVFDLYEEEGQTVGNFSVVMTFSNIKGTSSFQMYITRIDGKAFDFNTKAYQFIYNEYIYTPIFVRLTPTSATINVAFATSKIQPGVKGELIIFS